MGIICQRCTKTEKEEEDENYNKKNKEELFPKNSMSSVDCYEDEIKDTIKENKIEKNESIKRYSKSSKNIKELEFRKDINKSAKKMILQNSGTIEEVDDEDDFSKKASKSMIFIKSEQEIETKKFSLEDIKIDKKSISSKPFQRRKKKSSTVKQNQFFFNQIFSAEITIPISQENLIWERKGIPKNNYIRGKLLGKGAFGKVFESKNPIFNNKVAMKIIDKNKIQIDDNNEIGKNENDYIRSEINILKKLSHPNIVRIYEFYETDNYFYLINEFCQGGQLCDYINNYILSENQLCVIFYQVFSGLIYLHENNILHGDLKPENILISSVEKNLEINEEYAWIKIIDFGTAKIFHKTINKKDDIVGTLYFISPEVFSYNYDKYDEKSDIWSIGVILYKALTKKYPFIGKNENETIYYIIEKDYDDKNEMLLNYSEELQDLVKNLLMKDPNKRPSAKEALNHKWFKKFDGRRIFTNFKKEEMKPFIDNLYNFSFSKIHQLVIAFLVHNLPETESSQKILKLFRYFNESGNCELSKEELRKGLKEFKPEIELDKKFDDIFKELDGDNNGTIEFEEFLRGCIDKNEILNDKYLHYAFKFLDKENRKYLSPEQIISAFAIKENSQLKEKINNILNNSDVDKNGLISFEEFKILIYSLDKMK